MQIDSIVVIAALAHFEFEEHAVDFDFRIIGQFGYFLLRKYLSDLSENTCGWYLDI